MFVSSNRRESTRAWKCVLVNAGNDSVATCKHCTSTFKANHCFSYLSPREERTSAGFLHDCSAIDQIFTIQQFFKKSWEDAKYVCDTCLVDLERKHTTWFLVKSFGECSGRTVLNVACYWPSSLCKSCSDVCVRVGRVKSQPLTVGVELRKTCVLSPLLFIVYMNWDDSYRRVDEDATVRSCRINRLIFAHDLVLLASCILNGVFHIHLIGFLLRATKWG